MNLPLRAKGVEQDNIYIWGNEAKYLLWDNDVTFKTNPIDGLWIPAVAGMTLNGVSY